MKKLAIISCGIFLFCANSGFAQEKKIPKVRFFLEGGIHVSNMSVIDRDDPDFGLSATGYVHFTPFRAGMRYRKELGYFINAFRKENDLINHFTVYSTIDYYEETTWELYKDWNVPKINWLRTGFGYGWVYPFYSNRLDESLEMATFFVTLPVHWFELSLRAEIPRYKSKSGYLNGSPTDKGLGIIEIGAAYRFKSRKN